MDQILYGVIGLFVGLVLGSGFIHLFPYRRLQISNAQDREALSQIQVDYQQLQTELAKKQLQRQQEKQDFSRQKEKYESDLQRELEQKAEMENQYTEKSTHWKREMETRLQEMQQLKDQLEQIRQENAALEDSLRQQATSWKRELEGVYREKNRFQAQIKHLQQEQKAEIAANVEQQRYLWEQENMELRVQITQFQAEKQALEKRIKQLMAGRAGFGIKEDKPLQH